MRADNPFSRFLRGRIADDSRGSAEADAFVASWDRLETLVIRVYRAGQASQADEAELKAIRAELGPRHSALADDLKPYWKGLLAGGEPLLEDPFLPFLDAGQAANFVGDWEAMQRLPAAREAVNRWLVSLGASGSSR